MATLSSIITPSNITTATNTQTLENKTLTGAAMNGTLGATTPSTGAFTTLSSTTGANFATSSGDVGIGTASPASKLHLSSTGQTVLTITGDSDSSGADVGYTGITMNWSGAERWNIGPAGTGTNNLVFRGAGSNLMTLTTGGNLGIGTASPGMPLEVKGTAANSVANFSNTSGGSQITFTPTTNDQFRIGAGVVAANDFGVVNATRTTTPFVITGGASGGSVGIGTTAPTSGSKLHVVAASGLTGTFFQVGANGNYVVEFLNASGTRAGYIQIDGAGTGTTYNSGSDVRLKKNIKDAPSASEIIEAIKVRSFDWKSSDTHQRFGFVAQEVDEIYPEAVSKGYTDEDTWGIDYGRFTPVLIAEVQSLRKRLAALESN
jgi:hypothetical protein